MHHIDLIGSTMASSSLNEAIPAHQPSYRIEAMAGAFEHFVVFACWWISGHYVAFQSTSNQWTMELHVKRASSLKEAIFGKGKWRKLAKTMTWTRVMYYFYWDSQGGMEIQLFPNSYDDEEGVTVTYRYFDDFRRWISAQIVVPDMTKRSCIYLN